MSVDLTGQADTCDSAFGQAIRKMIERGKDVAGPIVRVLLCKTGLWPLCSIRFPIGSERRAAFVEQGSLDRGGTDVDADEKRRLHEGVRKQKMCCRDHHVGLDVSMAVRLPSIKKVRVARGLAFSESADSGGSGGFVLNAIPLAANCFGPAGRTRARALDDRP